jgi:endonuclease-3
VLAFSLGRAALPVDTHVARIATRLGWLGPGTPTPRAQRTLEGLVPPARRLGAHLDLIAHGRATCRAQRPSCGACVLAGLCPSAATLGNPPRRLRV